MQTQEIMQAQIDSALAGLLRVRERLAGEGARHELDLIGHDLEWAASHLDDMRHVWASLRSSLAPQMVDYSNRKHSLPAAKELAR